MGVIKAFLVCLAVVTMTKVSVMNISDNDGLVLAEWGRGREIKRQGRRESSRMKGKGKEGVEEKVVGKRKLNEKIDSEIKRKGRSQKRNE